MRDVDLPAFDRVFKSMAKLLRSKQKVDDDMMAAYFKALSRFEFIDVSRAADRLIESETFFPEVAKWREAIAHVGKGDPLLELSSREAAQWLDAERRGFEADPCPCGACVEAGVNEKPLRYVPTTDRGGEYARRSLGTRTVLLGHWAHGLELARWYRARADFYEVALRVKLGHPLHDIVGGLKGAA